MKQANYHLTGEIIGIYYDVYNALAHTYPEYIYEKAMMNDLLARGIPCRRQPEYTITYKDRSVGAQRLDLFVAQEVVVELKVVPAVTKLHKAQGISYLKVTGRQTGLLCNFGKPEPDFCRLYYEEPAPAEPPPLPAEWDEQFLRPALTYQVIGALFEVHSGLGPGFIYRIYANALCHELRLRGLRVQPWKVYEVIYHNQPVGKIKFSHLQIEDCLMLFPVTLRDSAEVNVNSLRAWLHYRQIPLGIVANFYPSRLELKVLRP